MKRRKEGFTLLELLIVVAILGIVMSIGFVNLRPLSGDLQNNASRVAGTLKQARAKAMSTTSAYRVVKTSRTTLTAEWANSCDADNNDWTADPKFDVTLDNDIGIGGSRGPLVCFTSRGIATSNPTLRLRDDKNRDDRNDRNKVVKIDVFLGGAVEIQ